MSEKPFFPPPPKADAPYRRRANPGIDVEPEKRPAVVASRPEPPRQPEKSPATVKTKAKPPVSPTLIHVTKRDQGAGPSNPLMVALAKWPRQTGLAWFLLNAFLFALGVRGLKQALVEGEGWVYRPGFMNAFAAFAAAGLWLVVWGVAFDDDKGEIPLWWWLGLFFSAILAGGLEREWVAILMPFV